MSKRYKVKFEEDGSVCKNDIAYLRKHPDCGIRFMENQPFRPDNKQGKFKKIDRNFFIGSDADIPKKPDVPNPPNFQKVNLMGQVITDTDSIFLPQDNTNNSLGRRLIGEHLENLSTEPYSRIPDLSTERGLVPRMGNSTYSHETPARPTRPVGDIELQDFGAGVGIPNNEPTAIIQTRIRPISDPRDTEFREEVRPRGITDEELIEQQIQQITRYSSITDEELIEQQIKQTRSKTKLPKRKVPVSEIEGTELIVLEPEKEEELILREGDKYIKKGKPQISQKEAEQIADKFLEKGITRSRTLQILEEFNLYDTQGEFELAKIADPKERAMIRRMKAQRIISEQTRPDTNLLPQRQEEIELRPDTPLTRGRTDIAPGRGRVEKVIDKVAGKLPEEYRTTIGAVKRNSQEFAENIRTKSLEAIQSIQARTTRTFGQNYKGITGAEIELNSPEGIINVRPPITEDITGIRTGDITDTDFNVLGRDYAEGFSRPRPKLNFAERLQTVRTSGEVASNITGGIGGLIAGFGVSELMGKLGVHNNYAIGAAGGASAGLGGRILTMAGSRMFGNEATQVATRTLLSSSRSLISSAAEGGIVGLALVPEDMLLNNAFLNAGMNHSGANITSGLITGGTATAIGTIGAISLGAAPETLGLSLLIGGVASGISAIIGGITGAQQDKAEQENINNINVYSTGRTRLLMSLPNNNYDFDKALDAFAEKDTLGMDDKTWKAFSSSAKQIFNPKPNNTPIPQPVNDDLTDDEKRVNDLFNKYVSHSLINKVCGDGDCKELKRHDRGELTDDEKKFLDDKTRGTWLRQANMSVELSSQEMKYTQIRINKAQKYMLNSWSKEGKVLTQLDPYQVETARLDPTFIQRYEQALKIDAQQKVIDAYQKNQTRIEQLPKNIRDMANADQEFNHMIHTYYETLETTSGQLDISVPQLIELQKLEGEAQKDKYQEIQFNNIKQNPVVVEQAKQISEQEDRVRKAQFYDIDQALFETDPTAITTWKPTDSQILQAHSAGMNLNEYTEYMHQLALGQAGDYSKLPKYSKNELRASGILDYSHFQDELQTAGYRKDLYLYNPETRTFTLNPNTSAIPSTQETFISRYTPKYLLKARQEYADMIIGLNKHNQEQVDNYNQNLMKELSTYGKHYDEIASHINDERLYQGRTDLLHYDIQKMYDANKLQFKQVKTDVPSVAVSQSTAMGRQLGQQVSLQEKYTLNDEMYRNVKLNIQSKGIKSPDTSQLEQAVNEVKESPETVPLAS